MYRGLLARPVDDADPGVMREITLAVPPLDWFGDAPTSAVVRQRALLKRPYRPFPLLFHAIAMFDHFICHT